MSDARGRLLAATIGVVLVVVAALVASWLLRDREFTASVPQPRPTARTAVVHVAPGGRACLDGATILRRSRVTRVRVGTLGRPGAPLTVTVSAPGYRAVARVPAGSYRDNDVVSAPIA